MKTLKIYGASDDLIETEGLPGCDEFNVYTNKKHVAVLHVKSKKGKLHIHCIYDGSWAFAITPEMDEFMPNWKIERSWGIDCKYSETVEITCPDDANLRISENKE